MRPAQILGLLVEFQGEKAALYGRHVAAARVVGQYDLNNTYQYVIAREEQHLDWLRQAIAELGGAEPQPGLIEAVEKPRDEAGLRAIARADAEALEAAVALWRPRLPAVSNARHRKMLELTLGEMLEQARFFQQAAAGQVELLGRRTGGARTPGSVVPTRWVG